MTAYDYNARVAQVAHELLDPGPMSHVLRKQAYRDFITANFDDSVAAPVYSSGGTNCAIFARGCLTQAGVLPKGRRPPATAITTWLGVLGFKEDDPETEVFEGSWIPVSKLGAGGEKILPGDVFYICSTAGRMPIGGGKFYTWTTWPAAANGHVGVVLFDGEGWMRPTAEGGGSQHLCRKSDGPKDLRKMGRTFRGVWRPNLMIAPEAA